MPIPPGSNATSTTIDLVAGSPGCSGTPLVCTATLKAPLGLDNFTVATYAGSDGNGAQLSVGSLAATIVSGANSIGANTIDLTLNGIVARFAVTTSPASIDYGASVPVAIGVEAHDATGAVIIGPGNFNVPITLTTPSPYVPGQFLNANGQDAFGPDAPALQITSPSKPVTVTAVTEVNGQVLPGLSPVTAIGGTAPGVTGSPAEFHVGGIPTRPPGRVPIVQPNTLEFASVTSPIQTFSVSEQDYSGTFTVKVVDPSIPCPVFFRSCTAPNDHYAGPRQARFRRRFARQRSAWNDDDRSGQHQGTADGESAADSVRPKRRPPEGHRHATRQFDLQRRIAKRFRRDGVAGQGRRAVYHRTGRVRVHSSRVQQ